MRYFLLALVLCAACGVDDSAGFAVDSDGGLGGERTTVDAGGAAGAIMAMNTGGVGGTPDAGVGGAAAGGAAGSPVGGVGGAAGAAGAGGAGGQTDPGRPLGDACINDGQCASNVCLNDRCCERRCDTECESCNLGSGKCEKAPDKTPCGDGPHCKRDSELRCNNPNNPNCADGPGSYVPGTWWEYNSGFLVTPQCQAGMCTNDVETNCRTDAFPGQIGFCGQRTSDDQAQCRLAN